MLKLLSLLTGPVFAKEAVETARRKRYYFNRVLYCTALLLAMFIVWEEYGARATWRGYRQQELMVELAETLFLAVSTVQYCAVFLFVPVFLCGAITSEREGGTLDLLFTTQLRDREIVLGKLASRAAVLMLLFLSALPVLSLVMLFGGIEPAALWRTQAVTLAAIVYASAHAIYFSAVSRSTVGSLIRTYWWMALWLLALPAAATLVVNAVAAWRAQRAMLVPMTLINPVFLFVIALVQEAYEEVTVTAGAWVFPAGFVLPLAWSGLLIWRAVVRLRNEPKRRGRHVPLLRRLGFERSAPRADGQQRARSGAETVLGGLRVRNPLWLRSRVAAVYDREGYLRRVQWGAYWLAGGFLVLVWITEPRALSDEEGAMTFLGLTWTAVALLTVLVAGTGLVGDRRRGFLELVLAAPLEAQEVVGGSMLAAAEHLRRIFWLPVALGLFFWVSGASPLGGVVCSWVTGGLFCAVLIAMGTLCSLAARSAPQALAPTFLLAVLMCVGTVMLIPIFEEAAGPVLWVGSGVFLACTWALVRGRDSAVAVGCHFMAVHLALTAALTCWTYDGRHEEYPCAAVNPGFWAIAPLDESLYWYDDPRWYGGPGRWYWALVCYWAALVANLMWARWWMVRRFDRLVGRTQGHAEREAPDEGAGVGRASR